MTPWLVPCVFLKDQTWTRILGPEIAPCPREPWNSAGSSQGRESQRRRLLEPSVLALKWRPRTGCSEQKAPKLWQRQAWDADKDFCTAREFEKVSVPSLLGVSHGVCVLEDPRHGCQACWRPVGLDVQPFLLHFSAPSSPLPLCFFLDSVLFGT